VTAALPPLRKGYAARDDLIQRRAAAGAFETTQEIEPGVTIADATYGGVSCIVCAPVAPRATILYLHGGGFRMGHPRGWTGFGSRLAAAADARVVLVDYRLAPEHPFPAGLHDAVAAYDAVANESGGAIFVAGDSAGGGLAASVVLARARSRGLILLSPWLDLTLRAATWESRAATDKLFALATARDAAASYLQGHPSDDPLVSPLLADLAGFPPVLIFASGAESLLGDASAFAEGIALAGGTVEAHLVAGMQHVWPTLFPDLPESGAALEAMARFVRQRL